MKLYCYFYTHKYKEVPNWSILNQSEYNDLFTAIMCDFSQI